MLRTMMIELYRWCASRSALHAVEAAAEGDTHRARANERRATFFAAKMHEWERRR